MSKLLISLCLFFVFSLSGCTEVSIQSIPAKPSVSKKSESASSPSSKVIAEEPTPSLNRSIDSTDATPTPESEIASDSKATSIKPSSSASATPLNETEPSTIVADLVVKITKPSKKITSDLGQLLFLSAELENPSDAPVSFIEFRTAEQVVGLVPKSAFSSFSYNWTPEKISAGTYSIFAVALDLNKKILAKSESVEVTLRYVSSSSGGGGGGGGSSFVSPPAPTPTSTPPPTLGSFTPGSGFPGNSVVLTGTNFTGATAVTFNGVAAASFTVNNATTITAIAPSGATDGVISVTTGGGSVNSATNFTFTTPPAGVHFVKADATGANSGANWIDAYPDLQTALGAAGAGEEIWIAAGTYKPTAGADRTIAFTLTTNVSLYGGFNGTEALRADRDFNTNSSILSGDLTGNDSGFANNGENSYHVVSNTAANGRLDGLIIQGGNADAGAGAHSSGSGLYVQADITLANTRFQSNSSSSIGAIYSVAQTITVDSCTFDNNKANLGGAILNQGGTLNISNNSVFSNNVATTAGGAIYTLSGSTINISDTTFNTNSTTAAGAGAGGGAIYHNAGNLTITDSSFTNNSTGQEGGAIFQRGSDTATYTRVIFQNNSAGNFGGAICNDSSTSNVNESVFDTNSGIRGGAIFGNGMTGTVNNAVFFNNSATQQGGAIAQPSGTTNIFNSTFTANSATNSGGAIINGDTTSGSTFNLTNTILWNNTAPTGSQITVVNATSVMTIGFSNLTGNLAGISNIDGATINNGTNNIATDPLFVNAADPNGADDDYRTADDGLQIQAASGALDTGTATGAPVIDIVATGTARPQGGGHDIGAYERP